MHATTSLLFIQHLVKRCLLFELNRESLCDSTPAFVCPAIWEAVLRLWNPLTTHDAWRISPTNVANRVGRHLIAASADGRKCATRRPASRGSATERESHRADRSDRILGVGGHRGLALANDHSPEGQLSKHSA